MALSWEDLCLKKAKKTERKTGEKRRPAGVPLIDPPQLVPIVTWGFWPNAKRRADCPTTEQLGAAH